MRRDFDHSANIACLGNAIAMGILRLKSAPGPGWAKIYRYLNFDTCPSYTRVTPTSVFSPNVSNVCPIQIYYIKIIIIQSAFGFFLMI